MTSPVSSSSSNSDLNVAPFGITSNSTSSTSSSDSISSAQPTLSILAFSKAIEEPEDQETNIAWQIQQNNDVMTSQFYAALVDEAAVLFQFYSNFLNASENILTPTVNQNSSNLQTVNTAISSYNSTVVPSDQAAINAMNNAIAAFQASSGDAAAQAAYNSAVATYNSYVNSRNNSSNVSSTSSALGNFNSQTNGINTVINNYNLDYLLDSQFAFVTDQALSSVTSAPLLSTVQTSPPATPSSVSSLSGSSDLASISDTVTPDPQTFVTTVTSIINNFTGLLASNNQVYNSESKLASYAQYILQNINGANLPSSFITKSPTVQVGTSGTISAGGGIGLASLSLNLTDPLVSSILETAIFSNNLNQQQQQTIQTFPYKLTYPTYATLAKLGVLAGFLVVNDSNGKIPSPSQPSTGVIVAQSYANQISNAVSQGLIQTQVQQSLSSILPNLSSSTNATLTQTLSSAIELAQLNTAVQLISQATNQPTLLAQLLATVPQAGVAKLLNIQQPFSTGSTGKSGQAAKAALASYLTNRSNINQTRAQQISNTAINNATKNQNVQKSDYQTNLQQELLLQGLNSSQAESAAQFSTNYVQSEVLGAHVLNQTFTSSSLQGLLNNQLVQTILQQNNGAISGRQLRDQLAAAFIQAGTSPENAYLAATHALTGTNAPVASLPLDALSTQIQQSVSNQSKDLSVTQSQQLATQVASLVLGNAQQSQNTSLRSQISDRLQYLHSLNDQQVDDKIDDLLRPFLNPGVDFYSFIQNLMDPANTILISAATSLSQSGAYQPLNYIKGASIQV